MERAALSAAEELRRQQLLATRAKAQALQQEAARYRWSVSLAAATAAGTPSTDAAGEAAATGSAASEKRVKKEEAQLHEAVRKSHADLLSAARPTASDQEGLTYGTVLHNRIKQYEAEIAMLTAHKSEFTLRTEEEIQHATLSETQEDIRQLHKAFERLQAQKEALQTALSRENTLKEQQEVLQVALETRLEAAEAGEFDNSQSSSETRARIKVTAEQNRKLMASMAAFMTKYFPPPQPEGDDASSSSAARQKGTITQFFGKNRAPLSSLNDFLENLMNQCMSSPHDPYITLDERHWPPYVELIVRSGIGQKHPHNAQKLKLTEFHQ